MQVDYYFNLIEIKCGEKQAIFENIQTDDTKTVHYDMIHSTNECTRLY